MLLYLIVTCHEGSQHVIVHLRILLSKRKNYKKLTLRDKHKTQKKGGGEERKQQEEREKKQAEREKTRPQ